MLLYFANHYIVDVINGTSAELIDSCVVSFNQLNVCFVFNAIIVAKFERSTEPHIIVRYCVMYE